MRTSGLIKFLLILLLIIMNISVTGIINSYHQFDREFWLIYKVLEKLHPNFSKIKMNLLKSKRINDEYLKDINKETFELEKDLLDEQWKKENEDAKKVGNETHDYIRNIFCTDLKMAKSEFQIDTELYKIKQLEELLKCDQGIFLERKLEYNLNNDIILIGIPDCFIIHDGIIDIIDWKTNDKINFKSRYEVGKGKSKKLKYPLNALDDCNGIQYQVQLSIYMWMLLKIRPDLKPGFLKIVQIKNNKIKKVFEVDYLNDAIDKLINFHIKNITLKEKIDQCKEIIY